MNAGVHKTAHDVAYYAGAFILVIFGGQFAWMVAGASGMVVWFLLLVAVGIGVRWFV